MLQDLKELGFLPNEIKVYESLLSIGETTVGGIINDLKIHRQIAYNALDTLEKRGLVSKTMKNKVYHFKPTDPEIIVENAQKQEMIAQRLAQVIKLEMSKTKIDNSIDIYNGKEGIRKFYLQMMNNIPKNGVIYIIQGGAKAYQQVAGLDFISKKLDPIRIKKNITSKNIMSEQDRPENKEYLRKVAGSLRQTRFLPYDNIINPVFTYIWDNHVSFISTGTEPFAIDIQNEDFYKSYLDHFEILWKMAKE
ncbi:MAG: helix-turn-helix domain-containing protein [Acholeplasmataceae bacterium]|nr:helix-turn-helix domain-containing protein [Acholeplasmataceae bacterium]